MKASGPSVYTSLPPVRQQLLQGLHHEIEDAVDEEIGDQARDAERPGAGDQPVPELVEMLQERHLRAAAIELVGVGQFDERFVPV